MRPEDEYNDSIAAIAGALFENGFRNIT